MLSNCVLIGNTASAFGGGAFSGTLANCRLLGNTANRGGGASDATLNNCALRGNSTPGDSGQGGGVWGCELNNCTLADNTSTLGGGAYGGTLNNSIVYFNTAAGRPDNVASSILNYCCTAPDPGGAGNITNAPQFVDYAAGDLRLQSNSPCINSGLNAHAPGATDLDGNPRTVSGTVDLGAYEFQGAGSMISYAWLQRYGLATDGSADFVDTDGDGHNNWQEWRCSTVPTDELSRLRIISVSPSGAGVTLTWDSVAGLNYFVERAAAPKAPFTAVATSIPALAGTTTCTDQSATTSKALFYRVGVQSGAQ